VGLPPARPISTRVDDSSRAAGAPRAFARRGFVVAGVLTLVVALALTGTPGARAQSASPGQPAQAERDRPGPPLHAKKGFLRSTLARMTLEEKVGQLFFTSVSGLHANDTTGAATNQSRYGVDTPGEVVTKYHLGGVLYFANNITNPTQLNAFSNSLQEVAVGQRSGIPLSLTIDQETGIVNRMQSPATEFPGHMAMGATRSPELAERAWTIIGKELRAVGVNWNFAPVLDVNTNPNNPVIGLRSLGEDPSLVGELGTVAVQAQQAAGVSATIKHFPGHGDTEVDSHFGLPLVAYDRDTLMNVHVAPFKQAIDAGVDAVMTAHMVVEVIDDELPSTLSREFLTGLLREELGFDGLIVTDALNMAAVERELGLGQDDVAVMAFEAGADVLLLPADFQLAYRGVLEAVRSGEISKKRLEASVMRVLEAKYDRGLFHGPFADPEGVETTVGIPEHLATADEVARTSPTLITNGGDVLPLDASEIGNALVVGPSAANTSSLAGRLSQQGLNTTLLTVSTTPTAAQRSQATAAAGSADVVLVTTTNARGNSSQRQLVAELAATGTPLIVVPAGLPYDAAFVSGADAIMVTYSSRPVAMRGAADVILGVAQPKGLLPVSIPAADGQILYPFGHGLSYSGP
jgi:beta-N-acetylhexosaminidase